MLKVRIFVKQLSKMFLPVHIVDIDYNEKTVTVRGCQHSDCDTCHDEYDWEQCEIMRFTDILDNSEPRKENFERLAKQANYHSGYGAAHVPTDLVIVGKGWWLERGEYDGSEWWDFKEIPKQINEVRNISSLVGGMWPRLKELNTITPIQERLEEIRKERKPNETL